MQLIFLYDWGLVLVYGGIVFLFCRIFFGFLCLKLNLQQLLFFFGYLENNIFINLLCLYIYLCCKKKLYLYIYEKLLKVNECKIEGLDELNKNKNVLF